MSLVDKLTKKERTARIIDFVTRGVTQVIDKDNLVRRLQNNEPLRAKCGIDPTSPDIHLGRLVPMLKIRDLQQLGCKPVLIIGDETGVIGDTSDKTAERPMLSPEVVNANMAGYLTQLGKVVDLNGSEVHYNSEWLKELNLREFAQVTDLFSVHEFTNREKIKARLDEGKRVSLREMLYPTLQGYDSYKVDAQVEVGGNDQLFNLLTGRTIQKHFGKQPQDVLTTELLIGTDGRKMSSSWGNTVSVGDTPKNIFGKLMSIPDNLIIPYLVNATRLPLRQIKSFDSQMKVGKVNPRDVKMELALDVTKTIYDAKVASGARDEFIDTFQKRNAPDNSQVISVKPESYNILDILVSSGAAESKTAARNLISQNGVKVDGKIISDANLVLDPGATIQKGKRSFFKID